MSIEETLFPSIPHTKSTRSMTGKKIEFKQIVIPDDILEMSLAHIS